MEQNLSTVINITSHTSVGISDHMEVHDQFHTMFLQTHQEIFYLREIFQSVYSRFFDASDHLQNHPASVDDIETTTPKTPH